MHSVTASRFTSVVGCAAFALVFAAAPVAAGTSGPSGRTHQIPVTGQRMRPGFSQLPIPIFAGGGSVPALTMRGWGNLFGVTPGQPAPQFGPDIELLYAASTGGSGQRWFINQQFDSLSPISPNPPFTDITNGRNFTYPYPGSPDFAIGSQLSLADLTTYDAIDRPTRGNPLVVPVVANPQALGFNLGPNSILGNRSLKLSRKSYCGIFTGVIVSWDDPQITSDNGGAVVSQPTTIDVVYRSDGSGTTFMLTDHLNDVCPAAGYPYTQGVGETFMLPNPQPPGSSFVAAKGAPAAINAVLNPIAGHGAISYFTAAQVRPLSPTGPPASLVINRAGNALAPTPFGAYEAIKNGPFAAPPPGYPPTNPNTYITDPAASDAYPIVGLVIMYFYGCYPSNDFDIYAAEGFFTAALFPKFGGSATSYDKIAEQNGVSELSDSLKIQVLLGLYQTQIVRPGGTCFGGDARRRTRLHPPIVQRSI